MMLRTKRDKVCDVFGRLTHTVGKCQINGTDCCFTAAITAVVTVWGTLRIDTGTLNAES